MPPPTTTHETIQIPPLDPTSQPQQRMSVQWAIIPFRHGPHGRHSSGRATSRTAWLSPRPVRLTCSSRLSCLRIAVFRHWDDCGTAATQHCLLPTYHATSKTTRRGAMVGYRSDGSIVIYQHLSLCTTLFLSSCLDVFSPGIVLSIRHYGLSRHRSYPCRASLAIADT